MSSKLFNQLKYIRTVHLNRYRDLVKLRNAFQSSKAVCIKKEWRDRFKLDNEDLYPLDLNIDNLWSTYEECVNFTIKAKGNKIICDVLVWDGDTFYGDATNQRWHALFELDKSVLVEFKVDIERSVLHLAGKKYEEKLEAEKTAWIKDHLTEMKINVPRRT